jgi:hypothetical protein
MWDLFLGGILPGSDKHAIAKLVKVKLPFDCIVKFVVPKYQNVSSVFEPMFIIVVTPIVYAVKVDGTVDEMV